MTWVRNWCDPSRMATATSDLRLRPIRPQSITALWPLSNYTATRQRHY